jgi:hypothetical protein
MLMDVSQLTRLSQHHNLDTIFINNGWVESFFSASLGANFVATSILALRIWQLHREVGRYPGPLSENAFYRIFRVLVDSGVLYSITLFISLILFLCKSNALFIALDAVSIVIH